MFLSSKCIIAHAAALFATKQEAQPEAGAFLPVLRTANMNLPEQSMPSSKSGREGQQASVMMREASKQTLRFCPQQ